MYILNFKAKTLAELSSYWLKWWLVERSQKIASFLVSLQLQLFSLHEQLP